MTDYDHVRTVYMYLLLMHAHCISFWRIAYVL